ncbi:hypothetical protein Tco_0210571 [Tanacetum coccineum]
MYPPMTSESSSGDSSSESSARLSHKRCRSLTATVTSPIHDTRALVLSRADLLHLVRDTLSEVFAQRLIGDVKAKVDVVLIIGGSDVGVVSLRFFHPFMIP